MDALFYQEGKSIYSAKSGRCVAIVGEDGRIAIQPGFNSMAKKIHDFLAQSVSGEPPVSDPAAPTEQGQTPPDAGDLNDDNAPPAEDQQPGAADFTPPLCPAPGTDHVELAAGELPPFNAVEGVQTPGFMDFCEKHNMSEAQIGLLVRKMEGLIHG